MGGSYGIESTILCQPYVHTHMVQSAPMVLENRLQQQKPTTALRFNNFYCYLARNSLGLTIMKMIDLVLKG